MAWPKPKKKNWEGREQNLKIFFFLLAFLKGFFYQGGEGGPGTSKKLPKNPKKKKNITLKKTKKIKKR